MPADSAMSYFFFTLHFESLEVFENCKSEFTINIVGLKEKLLEREREKKPAQTE